MKRIKTMAAGLTAILLLSLLALPNLYGQTKTWTNIKVGSSLKNLTQPYYKNGVLEGYTTFLTSSAKIKEKGKALYHLDIMDKNLRDVAKLEVIMDKNLLLMTTCFNEDSYLFAFVNMSKKYVQYDIYSKECKLTASVKREKINSKGLAFLSAIIRQNTLDTYKAQFPIATATGENFLLLPLRLESKKEYVITCINTKGKELWKYNEPMPKGIYHFAGMTYNEEMIVLSRNFQPNQLTKEINVDLVAINQKTGKKVYSIPFEDKGKFRTPYVVELDPESSLLFVSGEFFDNAKYIKSPSIGTYQYIYDDKGNEIKTSYLKWTDPEMGKVIKIDASGKNEDNERMLLHKVIQVDGKYFYVYELFKKVASAGGIAANVGGKIATVATQGAVQVNVAMSNLLVREILVVEMDEDLKPVKSHEFKKEQRRIYLPEGFSYVGPYMLAQTVRVLGGFDFEFANQTKNGMGMYVVYTSNNGERGKKFRNTITAQVYEDGKFTKDEIVIERDVDYYSCLPAQPGYVLMTDYIKKTKTLESRLEKLNY